MLYCVLCQWILTSYFSCSQNDKRLYFDLKLVTVIDIVEMMNNASCIKNSYEVHSVTSKKDRHYIHCTRNRTRPDQKSRTYITYSSKAERKHKCEFKLLVKYDKEHREWYMCQNAGHCLQHTGHIPVANEKKHQGKRNVDTSVL